MAPIYDSDLADQRFSKEHWKHYELWEKVEPRKRSRRRLVILAFLVCYLCLSAIPVAMDRYPKWRTLAAVRRLAIEVNALKRAAIGSQGAYRLRFRGGGDLAYDILRAESCSAPGGTLVRSGRLTEEGQSDGLVLLAPGQGERLGLPGLTEAYCFDYLSGSETALNGVPIEAFAVLPVKDLAEGRTDRLGVLLLSGPSGEIAFE